MAIPESGKALSFAGVLPPKRIKFGDDKIVVMPLFHPAAALYNGSMRQTLLDDFLKVSKVIDQL